MMKVCAFIVKKRAAVCILFAIVLAVSAVFIPRVNINYDDTSYLPDNSGTKAALALMRENFGDGGSASAMYESSSAADALAAKEKLLSIDGVAAVVWLDDVLLPAAKRGGAELDATDGEIVEVMLELLECLPRGAAATPYDLAAAVKNRFEGERFDIACALLENVSGALFGAGSAATGDASGAGGSDAGAGDASGKDIAGAGIDVDVLMALTESAGGDYDASAQSLRAFESDDGVLDMFARFADAVVASGLSAADAARILTMAAAALPESAAGATAYGLYAALSTAFSPDELPAATALLGAFGIGIDPAALADPAAATAPLPAETAAAIEAAKGYAAAFSAVMSGDGGENALASVDKIAALNRAGTALAGADAADYIRRLASVLPESGATAYDVAAALAGEFDDGELPVVLALMGGAADGMDASSVRAAAAPLGDGYASALDGLDGQIAAFYKDSRALFTLTFEDGDYSTSTYKAVGDILAAFPSGLYLTGNAAAVYYARAGQTSEIIRASAMAAALALAILFALGSSWLEPVLYIVAIAVSVVLNLGTNAIFGSVSYLTHSVACILQLALSIDYAVFLVSRYRRERERGADAEEAMTAALRRSLSPISASSLTTIACFVTIMFMRYKLGLDMGAVMAKGIAFSMLTVFLLLPGVIVWCDPLIAKSAHKTFSFDCARLGRFIYKFRVPLALLALAVAIPGAIIAQKNSFVYGVSASLGEKSESAAGRARIEEVFGPQENLALLVPEGSEKQLELSRSLVPLDGVVSVQSAALAAESGYGAMMPDALRRHLIGGSGYDRIVLTLDCPEEGERTDEVLAAVKSEAERVYGEGAVYMLGNTASAADIRESTGADFAFISALSVVAVALIVAVSFRSAIIPVLLVAVIEGAVWINMAIPALTGASVIFLGYMIISNVLLGSTIDYAILLTSNYAEARRGGIEPRLAVGASQSASARAILTSGSIFTAGGLILGFTSAMPAVKLLGFAIMRGGIAAAAMTMLVLPALLALLDAPTARLSRGLYKADGGK